MLLNVELDKTNFPQLLGYIVNERSVSMFVCRLLVFLYFLLHVVKYNNRFF